MQALKTMTLSLAMLACTYYGYVEGIPGAQNVLMFFIWAICLPIGLMALHPTMHKALAEKPPTPIASALSRCVSWAILSILIWTGHLAAGIAWGFYLFCAAVANHEVKKLRTQAVGA